MKFYKKCKFKGIQSIGLKTISLVPTWRNQSKTIGKGASSLISSRLIEQVQA